MLSLPLLLFLKTCFIVKITACENACSTDLHIDSVLINEQLSAHLKCLEPFIC